MHLSPKYKLLKIKFLYIKTNDEANIYEQIPYCSLQLVSLDRTFGDLDNLLRRYVFLSKSGEFVFLPEQKT